MSKYKTIMKIGNVYNKWTVLSDIFTKHRESYVTCQCQCGQIKEIKCRYLVNDKSTQCKNCSDTLKTGSNNPRWNSSNTIVPQSILDKYQKSAERDGVEFNLNETDIINQFHSQSGICPVTNESLNLNYSVTANNQPIGSGVIRGAITQTVTNGVVTSASYSTCASHAPIQVRSSSNVGGTARGFGIGRMNSDRGYIPDNIVLTSTPVKQNLLDRLGFRRN